MSHDGRPTTADTDLYSVPYANRQGGAATPIPGASDPAFNEYYPSLSPDDQFIAFNRIDKGQDTYNQPAAEVFPRTPELLARPGLRQPVGDLPAW